MTYPPGYPVQTQVVVQPYRCSTAHVVIAWICAVVTLGYLLPWAIAATRNRSNVVSVALIDLFLGWSLAGWVVALVMACGSDRPVVVVNHAYAPPPGYAPPGYGWAPGPSAYAVPPASAQASPYGSAPYGSAPYGSAPYGSVPYGAPAEPEAPRALPATPASWQPGPVSQAPQSPQTWAPEPTQVDPFGSEPTRPLPGSPWERSAAPYDPPAYGPGTEPDHRR